MTKIFPLPILGFFMSGIEHDMFAKFLKMKPHIFIGSKTKNVFEFIVDHYKRKCKMVIIGNMVLS